MELIQCYIENFGTLSGVTLRLTSGLNAFCLSNGQGKTTLCAFIKCMLYGLPESRRQSPTENERKHYTPWQGGGFGGSLTLRHEGRVYRLARSFGAKPAEDRLEVFDEQTGERTNALGSCPGETLFGIDRDGFADCAIFSEHAFSFTVQNESILSILGGKNVQEVSLAAALAQLEDERRLYEKKGGTGLLAQTEAEISRLTELRISNLQAAASLAQREADLITAKAELSGISRTDAKNTPDTRISEHFPKKSKGASPFLLTLSLLLLLASLIAGNFLHTLWILGAIPATLLLCLSFLRKNPDAASNPEKRHPRERASTLFEDRYRKCASCERAYVEALEATEEAAYLATQIEGLEKKRERMAQTLSDIKKTEALLTKAGERFRESHTENASERFSEALSVLGETRSADFTLGDHFSPFFLSSERYHSAELLGHGEKDRVSLARSLALLDSMPTDRRPPLLLDDPFLAYDDAHLELAFSALSTLAKNYQILYLTCSHSRMP